MRFNDWACQSCGELVEHEEYGNTGLQDYTKVCPRCEWVRP